MNGRKVSPSEVREKAVHMVERLSDVKDAARERAKIAVQTTKLRTETNRLGSQIERLYMDLGSMYYCMNKDDPDESMVQLCEELTVLLGKKDELNRQLQALAGIRDPSAATNDFSESREDRTIADSKPDFQGTDGA